MKRGVSVPSRLSIVILKTQSLCNVNELIDDIYIFVEDYIGEEHLDSIFKMN